jgi:hypothetical protein
MIDRIDVTDYSRTAYLAQIILGVRGDGGRFAPNAAWH